MKFCILLYFSSLRGSPPVWGAWIEISVLLSLVSVLMSPPVWGAWIEMQEVMLQNIDVKVAPRMGGVD